jgi:hypothetical protein
MSAILETEPGGELVCIEPFSAPPEEAPPGAKPRRTFRIGERVRYVGYYQDDRLKDNPAGWMVLFESTGSRGRDRYAATQTYFVTTECWEALKKYFAKRLISEPRQAVPLVSRKIK